LPTPRPGRDDGATLRRRRLDRGTIRFWERDGELLSFVAEQYAITIDQLARLTGSSFGTAEHLRDRWRRAGWIESHQLIWRGASFLWLTREGARVVQSPYRALSPNPGLAAHSAAVTDVRLLLERELSRGSWECERALARSTWSKDEGRAHLPDGVLSGSTGRIAVEVELTLKGSTRLDLILAELGRRYPEVWYFASPRVSPTLERLAAESPWRNVRIHPFPPSAEDLHP
jgi:hypothetical protein